MEPNPRRADLPLIVFEFRNVPEGNGVFVDGEPNRVTLMKISEKS